MKTKLTLAMAAGLVVLTLSSCKGQEPDKSAEKVEAKPAQQTFQVNIFNQSEGGIPNDDTVELFYPGQIAHWVRAIAVDKQGHIWLGTNHYGLARYNGDSLEYFGEDAGVGNVRINKIIVDASGVVWIATAGGLTKYENETFTTYTTSDGLANDGVYGMYLDKSGRLWLGTLGGVTYLEEGVFHPFEVPKPTVANPAPYLSREGVMDIFQDSKGQFWFSFDGQGISIYDGTNFRSLTAEDGLQDSSAGGFYEDEQGGIWLSSMKGGMSRYDGQGFTHFTKSGLIEGVETSGVYEDSKGDLWFAAEHQGVYRYKGDTFELFNEEDGLLSQGIIAFHEDEQGRFWVGGWKGLFRFDREAHAQGRTSFTAVTQNEGPWD